MEFSQDVYYVFKVTIEELRLISKALGERLREEDLPAARDLDRQIARSRIAKAEQQWRELTKLRDNLDKAEAVDSQGSQL